MATADLLRIWPSKVLTVSYLFPVAEGFLLWLKSLGRSWTGVEALKPFSKYQPVCCWVLSGACEQRACVWDNRAFTNGPLQQPCMGKAGQALLLPLWARPSRICSAEAAVPLFSFLYLYSSSRSSPLARLCGCPAHPHWFWAAQGSVLTWVHLSVCVHFCGGLRFSSERGDLFVCFVLFCFVCQLWIVENGLEFPGWGEEARFIFNKTCSRKGCPTGKYSVRNGLWSLLET